MSVWQKGDSRIQSVKPLKSFNWKITKGNATGAIRNALLTEHERAEYDRSFANFWFWRFDKWHLHFHICSRGAKGSRRRMFNKLCKNNTEFLRAAVHPENIPKQTHWSGTCKGKNRREKRSPGLCFQIKECNCCNEERKGGKRGKGKGREREREGWIKGKRKGRKGGKTRRGLEKGQGWVGPLKYLQYRMKPKE